MAGVSRSYTAGQVCEMVTDDDHEFFDLGNLEEDYDALDREQGTTEF